MQTLEHAPATEAQHFDMEKRRYNDTVTWLAEVLPGSMRTPFEYRFDGRELYACDGSPLEPIFNDAIENAKSLPGYEMRRRRLEKQEYLEMCEMMRGNRLNTMVVISDFPPELMGAAEGVGGYNAARKQTMLRVLAKTPDGRLNMYNQSLDGSNRQALEAIYGSLGFTAKPGELLGQRMHVQLDGDEQEFLIDKLMGVYDRDLSARYGGDWNAGIQNGRRLNTYDFVQAQADLLQTYLHDGGILEDNRQTRELAAAMKLRYEGRGNRLNVSARLLGATEMDLVRGEMFSAGIIADAENVSFSGCGLSSSAPNASTAEGQLGEVGYGNKADKSSSETLVWKDGVCRIENCPSRPGKTKVAQCNVCKCCQAWFDKGRDPTKLYKGIKAVQREAVTLGKGNKNKQTILSRNNNDTSD